MYTINIIAKQTGNDVRWLLPIWTLKANEYKLSQLREVSEVLGSGNDHDIEDAMMSAKTNIEDFLGKDTFSGQDPLSDKIDSWRVAISNHKKSEEELKETRKQLAQVRRNIDVDPKKLSDYEAEVDRLEQIVSMHKETMRQNIQALEHEIQILMTQNQLFTEWNINSLHPAGPTAHKHEYLLKNIRNEINIVGYPPLNKICRILRTSEKPGRPSASDLIKELGLKQRMANYTLVRLGYLLSEYYLLSPASLGLRYRYILTEKQKPAVMSECLIERLTMQMNDDYSGCTVHLEPVSSKGPSDDQLPKNSIQLTANSEIVSMRLNLFNDKEGVWNMTPAYETDPLETTTMRDNSNWLLRNTTSELQDKPNLSPMELDILGILSVFRGLRSSRRWMFEQLGYNQVTSRRYTKRLLDTRLLRLLYLPALEYCGLPVGLIVGGKFRTEETRKLVMDWMISKLPFIRVLKDDSHNMIAYLRLPADAITTIRSILREVFVAEAPDWFISSVLSNQTYQMTVFHRLHRANREGWEDPWL
jgi:exonuclease VII small subunit